MDFAQYWFSDLAAGPAPDNSDPGDPIANSLRFRGAQYLEHTFPAKLPNKINTVSCWFKLGTFIGSNDRHQLFCWRNSSTGDYSTVQWTTQVEPKYCFRFNEKMGSTVNTTSVFRDPGAWYHLVMQSNTRNVWINGVLQPLSGSSNINNLVNTQNQMRIGAWSVSADQWDGHIADFHFIDGQALDPTTFGRFNAEGVWVPVDPKKDGDTAWYGANGFHLDFADPTDIGKDVSGNGNHFTATGFDTTSYVSGYWVDNVANAVAGEVPNSQGTAYWTDMVPATADLNYGTGGGATNMQLLFDGSLTSYVYWAGKQYPNSGDVTSATFDLRDYAGNLTSIEVYGSGGTSVDYQLDLLDASKVVIAGSNKVIDSATKQWWTAPIPNGSDPRYLRISATADATGQRVYLHAIRINGEILSQSATTDPTYDIMEDSPTNNFATINPLYPGASTSNANLTTANATGKPTIIGLAGNVHVAGASTAWDGTEAGWTFTGDVDFGQRLTPDEISTANMPAPTIYDGRDHFQAITDTGANILTAAQAAFPSGLWWIKDRANANQHQLVDSIRGTATARRSPAGNIGNYAAPAGDSVAWCWNAPDEFNDAVSDITSTGRRNATAGFSIRKYTGNATTQQGIAHGLSTTPEFIIVVREETTVVNSSVWHKDLTANVDSRLVLENSNAAATQADVWSKAPDATNIYVGNSSLSNKAATDYTAYVWTSIPGYSAFGSYTGNANADGPFVYLGFRPALVIIKKSNASGTWLMYDSTRNTFNPETLALRPNLTNAEATNQGQLDFLSNGFKIRATEAQMNSSNNTYIYAAFAECPFQAPATAR